MCVFNGVFMQAHYPFVEVDEPRRQVLQGPCLMSMYVFVLLCVVCVWVSVWLNSVWFVYVQAHDPFAGVEEPRQQVLQGPCVYELCVLCVWLRSLVLLCMYVKLCGDWGMCMYAVSGAMYVKLCADWAMCMYVKPCGDWGDWPLMVRSACDCKHVFLSFL